MYLKEFSNATITLQFIFKVAFSLITVGWRQNLNRDYKKISPQKMSPSHSLETQTIIGL